MSSLSHHISAQIPVKRGLSELNKFASEPLSQPIRSPKIIAVGSGKGGVGKTFFAANLGYQLAAQTKSVVLLDANFGSPSIHNYFNIPNPKTNLKELILNPDRDINQLSFETGVSKLKIICGSPGTLGISENAHIIASRLIRSIRKLNTDYAIVDLGTGTNLSDIILFLQADEGIIVTNPEPTSIQEAFNFFKFCLLKKLETIIKGQPELMAQIDRAYDHFDDAIGKNLKSLIFGLNSTNNRLKHKFQNFKPGFLLNMVYKNSELIEATAFQMAIEEFFGIRLKFWGGIHFYPELKKSNAYEHPQEKFENLNSFYSNLTSQLIRNHSKQQITNSNLSYRKQGVRKRKTAKHEHGTLICSSRCSLWNTCSMQRGGYPCRMKYIGSLTNL